MIHQAEGEASKERPQKLKAQFRGIPESVFTRDFHHTVPGNSGKSYLVCDISDAKVYIFDEENPNDFYFEASVVEGSLLLRIKTKSKDAKGSTQRHPDLYAKDLALRSFAYFMSEGLKIEHIDLNWFPREDIEDNYRAFQDYMEEHHNPDTPISKKDITNAVFSTWSGRLGRLLGFTELIALTDQLIKVDDATSAIKVRLKRTEQVSIDFEIEKANRS